MAVLAPIPSARVRTATVVKPGLFRITRSAKRRSLSNTSMGTPRLRRRFVRSVSFRLSGRLHAASTRRPQARRYPPSSVLFVATWHGGSRVGCEDDRWRDNPADHPRRGPSRCHLGHKTARARLAYTQLWSGRAFCCDQLHERTRPVCWMASPRTDSSCEIHPSMELEDVFLHFLNKFENLPNPRSVAEAGITTDELEALTLWFSERWPRRNYRVWCESTFQRDLSDEIFASQREMFGALLLILASEVCRAKSTEDAVWPAVTAVLQADKASFPGLFVGGQPTTACKNAVVAGARRLKLRNLIDRYGAQEYFDTLKLQFGFTRRGAVRRLPEWLDGLGLPIAVRILTGGEPEYGDLQSSSFNDLWNALHDFRRSRVSDEYTSALLQASPWIRPEWASELMRAAKLRPNRTFAPQCAPEILDRTNEPVCELLLRWEYPAKPQLSLRLNEERIYEILGGRDAATFAIDGRVVDRWTVQEGGGWRGRRELPCQPHGAKHNLRPNLL